MKLEVTRGIECEERVYGDESDECGFRGEWDDGVGCDCDGDECGDGCGDGHAKGTSPAGIPLPPLHPPNNTPNNQSKPIVPTPSYSLS